MLLCEKHSSVLFFQSPLGVLEAMSTSGWTSQSFLMDLRTIFSDYFKIKFPKGKDLLMKSLIQKFHIILADL